MVGKSRSLCQVLSIILFISLSFSSCTCGRCAHVCVCMCVWLCSFTHSSSLFGRHSFCEARISTCVKGKAKQIYVAFHPSIRCGEAQLEPAGCVFLLVSVEPPFHFFPSGERGESLILRPKLKLKELRKKRKHVSY